MKTHRLTFLPASMIMLGGLAAPAMAQDNPEQVLRMMINCADIQDIAGRVACYDGTISGARQAIQQEEVRRVEEVQAVRDNFGNESLPRERAPQVAPQETELSATVERSRQVQPGIYAITLDNGSEWQFTESVPSYFFPPRNGVEVTVERGALGSYRMLIPGKAPVRVRRTR